MWSGGIDSTYVLAKMLKETTHQVHVHHIRLINREKRDEAEENACLNLLPKLKEIRDFTHTTTLINHTRIPEIPYDMAIVCFEAGVVSRALELRGLKPNKWTIGTHLAEGHNYERWEVIKHACNAGAWPQTCAEFELFPMVSKKDEMEYLQKLGLFNDCWFCRTPKEGKPCGNCKTCVEVLLT